MGRQKDYTEGSKRFRIFKALLCNAAVPYRSFSYYDDGTEYMRRMLRRMLKENELESRKSVRGLRFLTLPSETKIAAELMEKMPRELVDYYMDIMKAYREKSFCSSKTTNIQERILTNADAAVFFEALGAGAFVFDRPFLLNKNAQLPQEYPVFYNSREIKDVQAGYQDIVQATPQLEKGGPKNIIGSRMNGVYITAAGRYFTVYVLGKHSIVWTRTGESNMRRHIGNVMEMKGLKKNGLEGAVFLYSGDKVLNQVFFQKFNPSRQKNLLTLDMTYERTYFIPQDKRGIALMRIMSRPGWRDEVLGAVLPDEMIKAGGAESDGFDVNTRTYYDVFLAPDLTALKLFYRRAEMHREDMNYTVICFDFQEPEIRQIFDKLPDVNVIAVSFDEFAEYFATGGVQPETGGDTDAGPQDSAEGTTEENSPNGGLTDASEDAGTEEAIFAEDPDTDRILEELSTGNISTAAPGPGSLAG